MSDALSGRPALATGPTFSFGFNMGKIPDHGEDADPILRDGPDLGLVGVFDGMGGAGGTVYETDDGPRSGAYIASRIARDVVEGRMLELLEPDWNLRGEAAAADLHHSMQKALQDRLAELKAPTSRLRSKLLRALPTTMAVIGLQRSHRDGSRWSCHVFWAGDSRAYVVEANGIRQLSTDDLRDSSDAMTNLHQDSVVSNAISADTEFHVNYRRVELDAPFLLVCATDGCFGYLPSPMHFERLILKCLDGASSVDGWSAALQREIGAVTGDDAAMSVMGVGANFRSAKALFAPRLRELDADVITPLDDAAAAVARAERELDQLRRHQSDVAATQWNAYKTGYERFLHQESTASDESDLEVNEEESAAEGIEPMESNVPAPAEETEAPLASNADAATAAEVPTGVGAEPITQSEWR